MNNDQAYQLASRGARRSMILYLLLAISKLTVGTLYQAGSVQADGLNNFSDIIASLAVFLGLKLANRPADYNHPFGHEKYETLSSFIVSILMILIGLRVSSTSIQAIIHPNPATFSPLILVVTFTSVILLYLGQAYLKQLANKTQSIGLKATARDMRNDLLISAATILGTLASRLGYPRMDGIISLLVGFIILYSAYQILSEATFTLSDGFDPDLLASYRQSILNHPKVADIPAIRARTSTHHIFLDVTIALDPQMSVEDSHIVTEEVEYILAMKHHLQDVDIHVEPYHGSSKKSDPAN